MSVFIATKKSCSVTLEIWERGSRTTTLVESTAQETRQLGENLHVLVLHATGLSLAQDTVYAYDVRMTPTNEAAQGLDDQPGLLRQQTGVPDKPVLLGYEPGAYPTFSLAPDLARLRMLHGSCRKLHGGGPDALVIADELVAGAFHADDLTFVNARPHLLLLTGDQIYADDVSASLLVALRHAGEALMGSFRETFNPGGVAFNAAQVLPGAARLEWLQKRTSKLSSDHGQNHLAFLAEFYAMYLFCWSDVLWPKAGMRRVIDFEPDHLYPPVTTRAGRKQRQELVKDEDEWARNINNSAMTVAQVRRVLANLPSMMMFDDHEISDDWNLDQLWIDDSRSAANPLHRIVRNGLVAFSIFQAWGNDPVAFADPASTPGPAARPGFDLLGKVSLAPGPAVASARPPILVQENSADVLLGIAAAPATSATSGRVLWDWSLDGPQHRVIALDPRTHRDFTDHPDRAGLLTNSEIERQLWEKRPQPIGSKLCFVIAPAPVIGHPIVEEMVQPLNAVAVEEVERRRRARNTTGARDSDQEAWSGNRRTMEYLLKTLAGLERVVLLSGDVHYAFTNHTAYEGEVAGRPGITSRARIVQLCSSAQRNTEMKTKTIQTIGYAGLDRKPDGSRRVRGWLGAATGGRRREDLTLNLPAALTQEFWDLGAIETLIKEFGGTAAAIKSLATNTPLKALVTRGGIEALLLGVYWNAAASRLTEFPLVLPDGPWFDQATVDLVNQFRAGVSVTWRYGTVYVSDDRSDAIRARVLRSGSTSPTAVGSGSAEESLISHTRAVVGMPNIGEIRVQCPAGGVDQATGLTHTLHWWLTDNRRATTVHQAPLTVPVDADLPTGAYI